MRRTILILTLTGGLLAACGKKPESTGETASAPSGKTAVSVQDSAELAPPPPAPAAAEPAPGSDGAANQPAAEAGEIVDLTALRAALNSYMQKTGKTPEDLNDLVKAGYFRALPVAPNGYRLFYDPITVSVSMVKKW